MSNDKTYPEERLIHIMETVKNHRSVSVDELSTRFDVTGATVRADLRTLESRGLISRTHGGAILREMVDTHLKMNEDPVYSSRMNRMDAEKAAIGAICARYLMPYDCYIIDDGTTMLHVARNLDSRQKATIITNGLSICNELASHPRVTVICTGGALIREDLAFNGRAAEEMVGKFHTNCTVLGASGITVSEGLTAPDEHRAELKKKMISRSVKTIVAADHTKLTRVSLVPVCEISMIDVLITDWGAAEELLEGFRQQGIEVIVAPGKELPA